VTPSRRSVFIEIDLEISAVIHINSGPVTSFVDTNLLIVGLLLRFLEFISTQSPKPRIVTLQQ
jgi:hypothetical protein